MGTPTKSEVQPFTTKEIVRLLETAKNQDPVQALETLRTHLTPLAEWLDMPAREWAGKDCKVERTARIMPVFDAFGVLPRVGLSREGQWLTIIEKRIESICSGELATLIAGSRRTILSTAPFPVGSRSLSDIERLLGNAALTLRAAFLRYLKHGLENIEKMLKRREERLRSMQSRLSTLSLFLAITDPIERAGGIRIPGYAKFLAKDKQHATRMSGTYLVKKPVVDELERDSALGGYFMHDDSWTPQTVELLLFRLHTITETIGTGQRDDFSDEEVTILKAFLRVLD